jgi:hypothetical protein
MLQHHDLVVKLLQSMRPYSLRLIERDCLPHLILNSAECLLLCRVDELTRPEHAHETLLRLSAKFDRVWLVVVITSAGGLANLDGIRDAIVHFAAAITTPLEITLRYSFSADSTAEVIAAACRRSISASPEHRNEYLQEVESAEESIVTSLPSFNEATAMQLLYHYGVTLQQLAQFLCGPPSAAGFGVICPEALKHMVRHARDACPSPVRLSGHAWTICRRRRGVCWEQLRRVK